MDVNSKIDIQVNLTDGLKELVALQSELEGYKAENDRCRLNGYPLSYSEDFFTEIAKKIRALPSCPSSENSKQYIWNSFKDNPPETDGMYLSYHIKTQQAQVIRYKFEFFDAPDDWYWMEIPEFKL